MGITNPPVTIKNIENTIINKAFEEGWVSSNSPKERTGKKDDFENGHMTQIMEENGSKIEYIDPNDLFKEHDALLMATGATKPFDPTGRNPGRELKGIQFAMDFLTRNTKSLLDSNLENGEYTSAKDKNVIVIGGGDTGADCIGTSLRHGCKEVVNFELLDKPPKERAANNPWPQWPRIYRLDYSHAENKAKKVMIHELIMFWQRNLSEMKTVMLKLSKLSKLIGLVLLRMVLHSVR